MNALARLLAIILGLQFGTINFAIAAKQDAAKRRACESVISIAKEGKFVRETPGEYHCESVEKVAGNSSYFIVNLKYWSRSAPKDFEGSTLVGWYAVKKSDSKVYEMDADGNVGKRLEVPHKLRKPNHAIQQTPPAPVN